MSLAAAREIFRRDFADSIQKGRNIKITSDTRPGTVADLFAAYVAFPGNPAGKPSWQDTRQCLDKIANVLGGNRSARSIEAEEIVEAIRPIYDRDARSMADHVRSYVRSAYSWGLKSEHDYRSTSPRRFQLAGNPASGIPTEPKVTGTRWLGESEYLQLYRWLRMSERARSSIISSRYPTADADRTTRRGDSAVSRRSVGRLGENYRLVEDQNHQPHAIPVPLLAAELIESIKPNKFGWFFPSAKDPTKPVSHGTLYSFCLAPA